MNATENSLQGSVYNVETISDIMPLEGKRLTHRELLVSSQEQRAYFASLHRKLTSPLHLVVLLLREITRVDKNDRD